MKEFDELIKICEQFINNAFDIEEFQHKIEKIILPDNCKKALEKEQYNACNKLEEIRYCYSTSQKAHADKVAFSLIKATLEEQKNQKL